MNQGKFWWQLPSIDMTAYVFYGETDQTGICIKHDGNLEQGEKETDETH